MPHVSVILPVRNGAAHIGDALGSLLAQTFTDFEIIIIDDGSTDNLNGVLATFRDDRIRLSRFVAHRGICEALNHGIETARGVYLARMDADDICEPGRLETQIALMEKRQDVGVCGSWVKLISTGDATRIRRLPTHPDWIKAYALFDNPFVHSSVMINRSFLDRNNLRYDKHYERAEDYDLWARLLNNGNGVNIPRPLLQYRIHGESVTTRAAAEMDDRGTEVLARQFQRLGIRASEDDIRFHRYLGTNRLWPERSAETIARAERWLRHLAQENRLRGWFVPRWFDRTVMDVWFAACYHSIHLGYWVPYRFIRSCLLRGSLRGITLSAVMIAAALRATQNRTVSHQGV